MTEFARQPGHINWLSKTNPAELYGERETEEEVGKQQTEVDWLDLHHIPDGQGDRRSNEMAGAAGKSPVACRRRLGNGTARARERERWRYYTADCCDNRRVDSWSTIVPNIMCYLKTSIKHSSGQSRDFSVVVLGT